MGNLPTALVEADQEMEDLMAQLEKGQVPDLEVSTVQEEEPIEEPVIETPVDDPQPNVDENLKMELERANQRYRTLEGMMKANAARSREIIAELKEQVAASKKAEVETPLDIDTILTEDEKAEFGESGVKVLEKLAGAIAAREIERKSMEVEQRLLDMQQRVEQAEASASGHTTWDLVERINPGAKAINESDVGWFAFLSEVDPLSGSLYRDIGEAAAKVNDIQRLSELIDTYRRSANLAKPKIPVKPSQARPGPTVPTNDGSRPPKSDKRVYSQEEIREFYDSQARGRKSEMTKGLDAAGIKALEADIDAAIEEGRVIL